MDDSKSKESSYNKNYFQVNKERILKKRRDWYHKNKDRLKESKSRLHKVYYRKNRKHLTEYRRNYYKTHKNIKSGLQMRYLTNLRIKVLEKFGSACNRCGFSDTRALQIDHINGGGTKDLRSKSTSRHLNEVLRDVDNKYQLLCANCNWIKKSENKENRTRLYSVDKEVYN